MGAQQFYHRRKGKTMYSTYKEICEDTRDEHGHEQGYSGEIHDAGSPVDITSEFKRSGLTLDNFINNKELNKRDCFVICVKEPKSNTNKIKSQVEHHVTKGTKKWVLKYVVSKGRFGDEEIAAKNTKGEAVKIAREHTEKTQEMTNIRMEKRLEGGGAKVATITYKTSTSEQLGEWIFFGEAPC